MDMKEEMMNDAIDDVMEGEEDDEEETNGILNQVLDEIGISLDQSVSPLKTNRSQKIYFPFLSYPRIQYIVGDL